MKRRKILVFAQEAGAAEALIPVLKSLSKLCDCNIKALEPAATVFRRNFNDVQGWTGELDTSSKGNWDLLLVGYGRSRNPEVVNIFRLAKKISLTSVFLLDNWKGIDRFFRPDGNPYKLMPDFLLVMDEQTKNILVEGGIEDERITVVGNPRLEWHSKIRNNSNDRALNRKLLGVGEEDQVYFLASEILHWHSYWTPCSHSKEETCINLFEAPAGGMPLWKKLENNQLQDKKSILLIRSHPNEKITNINNIHVVDWNKFDEISLLQIADGVFGLTSMFVLLSVAVGIPTFNVAPYLDNWHPNHSFLLERQWERLSRQGFYGKLPNVESSQPAHKGATKRAVDTVLAFADY